MFRHIVLLTLSDAATEEDVLGIIEGLTALPSAIPEITSYVIGRDAGLNQGNAHLSVMADFDDEAGYLVYRDHPSHQRVIEERIRPYLIGRSAIQFAP